MVHRIHWEYPRNYSEISTNDFLHAKIYHSILNSKILEFVGDIIIILSDI